MGLGEKGQNGARVAPVIPAVLVLILVFIHALALALAGGLVVIVGLGEICGCVPHARVAIALVSASIVTAAFERGQQVRERQHPPCGHDVARFIHQALPRHGQQNSWARVSGVNRCQVVDAVRQKLCPERVRSSPVEVAELTSFPRKAGMELSEKAGKANQRIRKMDFSSSILAQHHGG